MDFYLVGLLTLTIFLITLWTFREIKCINRNNLCTVKGPKGFPVLGNLFPLLRSSHAPYLQYTKWAAEFTGLLKVKVGTTLAVIANDLDSFTKMFGKTGNKLNFRVRESVFALAMGNKGLAASDGEVWKDHRTFTTKAFRDLKMGRSSTDTFIYSEVLRLVARIKEKCTKLDKHHNGYYAEGESDINLIVFSIIWSFVAGNTEADYSSSGRLPISLDDHNIRKMLLGSRIQLAAAEQCGGWNFSYILQLLWILASNPLQLLLSYLRRLNFVRTEFEREKNLFVENQKEDVCKNLVGIYLRDLGKKSTANIASEMNEANLEVFMSDFVIAGVESVTSSIRWTLLYLAVHQEYMIELRTELDNFLKDSTMAQLASYSSRHELPYLEAVISESLRISPAVPMIVHVNHEDFVGVENFIPKGTWVMGNIWAVHHDHKVFEHPDSFRPTRFLKPIHGGGVCFKKELMEKCCSFSVGPRRCVGEQLSRMELHAFVALLVIHFDIQINPKKQTHFTLKPKASLSLAPTDDYLMFRPRRSEIS